MKIGLAFVSDGNLYFRDFDGAAWSGNFALDTGVSLAPVVKYNGAIPFIFYGKELGPGQDQPYYVFREGAGFGSPMRMTGQAAALEKVLCYDPEGASHFYDRTSEAASSFAADIYHPDSGKLFGGAGTALYLGQSEGICFLTVILSANGAGGAVAWQYWDGASWESFIPDSGAYHFNSSPAVVRLWADSAAIPSDWQACTINGINRFWIRVLVTTTFDSGPVGSQITAAMDLTALTGI
jgi:hypothetical protein